LPQPRRRRNCRAVPAAVRGGGGKTALAKGATGV